MVWYLDTSAFLKLITTEEESPYLRDWFSRQESVWSSQLLYTESIRAGARLGIEAEVIKDAIETISPVLPSAATFVAAARLQPSTLRSLDAVHLATALEIGDDLAGIVVYDERLASAARAASISVLAPC